MAPSQPPAVDSARTGGVTFVANLVWALRLAWQIRKRTMLALLGTMLLRSILPVTLALAVRALVDALVPLSGRGPTVWRELLPLIGLTSATLFVDSIASAGQAYLRQRLEYDLNLHLNMLVTETAAGAPPEQLEQLELQDLGMRTRSRALDRVASIPSDVFLWCTNVAQLGSLVSVLAWIEPLALLVVPLAVLGLAGHRWHLARRAYQVEYGRTVQRRWQVYYLSLLLDYQYAFEVKLLGLTRHLLERFSALLQIFRVQDRAIQRATLGGNVLSGLTLTIVAFGLLIRVVQRVGAGLLTVGDVVAVWGVLGRLSTNIQLITSTAGAIREEALYCGDVRALLELPGVPASARPVARLDAPAAISFEDVSFRYADTDRDVLSGISLRIEPGQMVAIVGENGAGKSTLVKLIAGLYRPSAGRIMYGAHALSDIPPDVWTREISCVFQQFNRYEVTVAENIAFGDWERWHSAPAVERFARAAGIHTAIQAMPAGYETLLGRFFGTYRPSDGQWQRIALARALAREASRILILDEPTASVDARAESDMFRELLAVARGRTTVLISHRFANVRLADQIFVLDGGRLIEAGTHAALMARGGTYAALYLAQSERFGEPAL